MTLFINNRLVECASLRRATEAAYAPVLPRHQHPWIYMALELPSETIDVNVHPTKMEVQFLDEHLIAERLQELLAAELRERGGTRTFDARPILLAASQRKVDTDTGVAEPPKSQPVVSVLTVAEPPKRAEENKTRIRTDPSQRSLESIWRESSSQPGRQPARPLNRVPSEPVDLDADEDEEPAPVHGSRQAELAESAEVEDEEEKASRAAFEEAQQLTSVQELKARITQVADKSLTERIGKAVYVGPADRELVVVQCGKLLCLVNLVILAQ